MTAIYEFNDWDDSPGGWRSRIKNVIPDRWISIVEALSVCKNACPEYPTFAHDMLVWRLQNGHIGAKAASIDVRFGDDDEIGRYLQMPVIEEWGSEAWASKNSEVWVKGSIRIIDSRAGTLRRIYYQDIGVDREGLERLESHLHSLGPPVIKPKAVPPAESVWLAWVQARKASGPLPSVETLANEAQQAFPENKITQSAMRRAFGGGKRGPRKPIS